MMVRLLFDCENINIAALQFLNKSIKRKGGLSELGIY